MVGGGVVYLDEHRPVLLQISPAGGHVPRRRDRLCATLLAPAVAAFRAAGCWTARIDDLTRSSSARPRSAGTAPPRSTTPWSWSATSSSASTTPRGARPGSRADDARGMPAVMRRHVSRWRTRASRRDRGRRDRRSARAAYATALGMTIVDEPLTEREEAEVRRWEDRLADEAWTARPAHAAGPPSRSPGEGPRRRVRRPRRARRTCGHGQRSSVTASSGRASVVTRS